MPMWKWWKERVEKAVENNIALLIGSVAVASAGWLALHLGLIDHPSDRPGIGTQPGKETASIGFSGTVETANQASNSSPDKVNVRNHQIDDSEETAQGERQKISARASEESEKSAVISLPTSPLLTKSINPVFIQQTSEAEIRVAVMSANVNRRVLTIRLALMNHGRQRLYYQNARMDQAQIASSEDGSLGSPSVTQMPTCDYRYSTGCLTDPALYDIERFAYIDPDKSASFSLSWNVPEGRSTVSPVSFGLALVGRLSEYPASQTASAPKIYRFNFINVPVTMRD